MKKNLARLLSLVLSCIMVMSFIQLPVSASAAYVYPVSAATFFGANRFVGPSRDMHFNVAYTIDDPDATYSLSKDLSYNDDIIISSDGILTIKTGVAPENSYLNSNATGRDFVSSVYTPDFNVYSTTGDGVTQVVGAPNFNKFYAAHDYDFEDGNAHGLGTVMEEDGADNHYVTPSAAIPLQRFFHNRSALKGPIMFEVDMHSLNAQGLWFYFSNTTPLDPLVRGNGAGGLNMEWINDVVANWGATYYPLPTGYSLSGWHSYKWKLNLAPYTYNSVEYKAQYDLYIDDKLVLKNCKLKGNNGSGTYSAASLYAIFNSHKIDNFKVYQSTIGFAYDVSPRMGISGTNRAIYVDAKREAMRSNIPEKIEYAFYECSSDGVIAPGATPIQVSDTNVYAVTNEDVGKTIKVAARITEDRVNGCSSPWVFSDKVITINPIVTTPLTVGTKGYNGQNVRFKLSETGVNSGNKTWTILDDTDIDGVSITADGIIEIDENPSDSVILMSFDEDTFAISTYAINFDPTSTSSDVPLVNVLNPVMFAADVTTSSQATISAGSYDFTVGSDAESFKLIIEEGTSYLFVDDVFVESTTISEDIVSLSIANGEFTSYYAGSPLKTPGLFKEATIADAYEYCEILTPITSFYNESAIYPDPESYSYKWYLDGQVISTDASFILPNGIEGQELYCEVTCITDTEVTIKTNTLIVGAQYTLTVDSAGHANLHLRTTDTAVYVVFAGGDDIKFYDMDISNVITPTLDPATTYSVLVIQKDSLRPRGLGSVVVPSTETVTKTTLPEGSTPVINLVVKSTDVVLNPAAPYHFGTPVSYDDLITYLADNSGFVDKSAFIIDASVSAQAISSYDNFDAKPYGFYRFINIPLEGDVTENVTVYNKLYKLFDNSANYSFPAYETLVTQALGLKYVCLNCGEFTDTTFDVCETCLTRGSVVKEYDTILGYARGVSSHSNLCSLMGTEGKYFPASATLEALTEQSAASDGMLNFFEIQLEKVDLPTDAVGLLAITSSYGDAVASVDRTLGLEDALDALTEGLILDIVEESYQTSNVRFALDSLGSLAYDSASANAKEYAAGLVKGKTFADTASLATAVETALRGYREPVPNVNDNDVSPRPSSNSVSITGSVTPVTPPVITPVSLFNDMATTHWAYPYVQSMNVAGVLTGYNGNFRPEDDITRAEFAKVICTALGIDSEAEGTFSDVGDDAWYAPFVNALASSGIAKGDGETFRPDDAITRQDAVVLLERALVFAQVELEEGDASFADSDMISDYAKAAVASLVKAGVINGLDDGSFAPQSNITRAQVAKIICVATKLGGDK